MTWDRHQSMCVNRINTITAGQDAVCGLPAAEIAARPDRLANREGFRRQIAASLAQLEPRRATMARNCVGGVVASQINQRQRAGLSHPSPQRGSLSFPHLRSRLHF